MRRVMMVVGILLTIPAELGWCASGGVPTWVSLSPSQTSGCSTAYDPLRDRLIVVIPHGNYYTVWTDIWALSFDSMRWTLLLSEPLVLHPGATYDPVRDRVILEDGLSLYAVPLSGTPTWIRLGDVPFNHIGHPTVYDPIGDRLVCFGDVGQGVGATWALTLSGSPEWRQLVVAGASPPARANYGAVYDPAHGRMVIFGGDQAGIGFNDVWALDLVGDPRWTQLNPSAAPPPMSGLAAVFDPVGNRMVITDGGRVWSLFLGYLPAWSELKPSGPVPGGVETAAAVYDPLRGRVVTWGSEPRALSLGTQPNWGSLPSPPPVGQLILGYDHTHCKVLAIDRSGELWSRALPIASAWSRIPSRGTKPPSQPTTAIYDPAGDRLITYGNSTSGNAVWSASVSDSVDWTALSPGGSAPPLARLSAPALFDPARRRMLILLEDNPSLPTMVWALSLASPSTWSHLSTGGAGPLSRVRSAAVYDPTGDRIVLFGGSGFVSGVTSDTWAFSLANNTWSELSPSSAGPSPRFDSVGLSDPPNNRFLLFGGSYYSPGEQSYVNLDDLWALSLSSSPSWTQIVPAGVTPPMNEPLGATIFSGLPLDSALVLSNPVDGSMSVLDLFRATFESKQVAVHVEADGVSLTDGSYVSPNPLISLSLENQECLDLSASHATIDGTPIPSSETVVQDNRIILRPRLAHGTHSVASTLVASSLESISGSVALDLVVAPRAAILDTRTFPQPSHGRTEIMFTLTRAAALRLDFFDLTGRRVGRLSIASGVPGTNRVLWDGTAGGRQLGNGVYVLRITASDGGGLLYTQARVVLLR